jgi:hypothetical protein
MDTTIINLKLIDTLDIAPFKSTEAKQAVRGMNTNSAPGPYGIGPAFYDVAWPHVEEAVMEFLAGFHCGSIELEWINRAHIVLLPKHEGATVPNSFRPVSLQNCPVKIITKILTTRLHRQITNLINPDQTGFLKGRLISENFIYASELVQCCHRWGCPTMVLKFDFAKAFDSVSWSSLLQALVARGFPDQWCSWIHMLISTSRSAVLVNECPGP